MLKEKRYIIVLIAIMVAIIMLKPNFLMQQQNINIPILSKELNGDMN